MTSKHVTFLSVFLGFLALDQVTKIAVYTTLQPRLDEIVLVPGLLSIVHVQNPAAAFGMLGDVWWRFWAYAAITVFAVVALAIVYRRLQDEDRGTLTAMGLIVSGIVGNAIDRLHKRSVTDFIRVHGDVDGLREWLIARFGTAEWPTFNVADSALVVGSILFVLVILGGIDDADDGLLDPDDDGPNRTGSPTG